MGCPQLAILEERVAAFNQFGKRVHRRRHRARCQGLGILQGDIEPCHRIETRGGARFRIARRADRNAARRFGRGGLFRRLCGGLFRFLARFYFDLLAVLARLRSDFALGLHGGCFRFRLKLLDPIGNAAAERRAFE